jgi:hypothetical protein
MLEKLGTSFCLQVFYSCGSNNTRATETIEEAGLLSGRFHARCLRFIVVSRDAQVVVLISHAHTAEVSGSGTLESTAVRGTASAAATAVKRAQPAMSFSAHTCDGLSEPSWPRIRDVLKKPSVETLDT